MAQPVVSASHSISLRTGNDLLLPAVVNTVKCFLAGVSLR